jgi:hypothetical protein
MKITCKYVFSHKVVAICEHTGYRQTGRSNREARTQLKWLLYSKMADKPFSESKIIEVLGFKWSSKLGLSI